MLNWQIVMRRAFSFIILLILIFGSLLGSVFSAQAQEEDETPQGGISAPAAGEALQGAVPIIGTTAIEGFEAWSLSFAYVDDTTGTWFLIGEGTKPIEQDVIAQWNTSTITDGTYNLRLILDLDDGEKLVFVVPNLRIRNYSVVETSTPTLTPTIDPASASATPTPTSTPIPPTPTPLPTNPIEISNSDFTNSLSRGGITALVLFLIVGLYTSIRRTLR